LWNIFKVNSSNLFQTFIHSGEITIRRLRPIRIDYSINESREVIFTGMTQIMSPNGPIPVQCIIEGAKNLSEVATKLPEAIEKTVQAMIAEAQEMRCQESSRIIVPDQ